MACAHKCTQLLSSGRSMLCVCFLPVMHRDQKGYDYFMACGFNESFGKLGLFYLHLKLTFCHFWFEKSIYIEKPVTGVQTCTFR